MSHLRYILVLCLLIACQTMAEQAVMGETAGAVPTGDGVAPSPPTVVEKAAGTPATQQSGTPATDGDQKGEPTTTAPSDASATPPAALNSQKADSADDLLLALQAVTGEPPSDDMRELLHGVVEIERNGEVFTITRTDGQTDRLERNSDPGKRLFRGIEQASVKMAKKLGHPVGSILPSITAVHVHGHRVTVKRDGPEVIPIAMKHQKQDKKYWVKEIKLGELSFDVGQHDGVPALQNVEQCSVVMSGTTLPVELRDFCRRLNKHGETVYIVGIKNPLPKMFSAVFGLHDVLHLHFTEHKRKQIETEEVAGGEKQEASKDNAGDASSKISD